MAAKTAKLTTIFNLFETKFVINTRGGIFSKDQVTTIGSKTINIFSQKLV